LEHLWEGSPNVAHRISIIGAGSTVFSPQMIRLLINSEPLAGSTVVMMDIDAARLEMMHGLARVAVSQAGADLTFKSTTDRRKALDGADFVIVVAPVGGYLMRENDLEIPARYGVYTLGGETVGPAVLMRAFRHAPLLLDICHELEELSPDAWLFSYTNPAGPVLMAMEWESDVKKAFLCTCSAIPRRASFLAQQAGVEPDELAMPAIVGGLNHCAAILKLRLKDGRDALPLILKNLKNPIEREMLGRYGILPYCTGHWAEFYPRHMRLEEPYQGHLQGLKLNYGYRVRNMGHDRERARIWEQDVQALLEEHGKATRRKGRRDALKGSKKQEDLLSKVIVRGEGIEVCSIIEAIVENRNEIHAVIVRNGGAIANLPPDAPVEVSAVVGANGILPLQVGPLPEPFATNLRKHIDYYELIAEAALAGDRKMALDALLHDPLTSSILTFQETEKLFNEMMETEAEFLPQFR
jgi:alpha-galactosidase